MLARPASPTGEGCLKLKRLGRAAASLGAMLPLRSSSLTERDAVSQKELFSHTLETRNTKPRFHTTTVKNRQKPFPKTVGKPRVVAQKPLFYYFKDLKGLNFETTESTVFGQLPEASPRLLGTVFDGF